MISTAEITTIIKEQEERMHKLFKNEKIVTREFQIPSREIISGAANIVTGPRRCGKSTFAFMLANAQKAQKFAYVNFDDERLTIKSSELNQVIAAMHSLKGDVDIFVFDEIQEIPGWEKFASRLAESNKLILTGSNARMLSTELSTYMTGRHMDHTLFPFSFREFLEYKDIKHHAGAHTTAEKAEFIALLEKYLSIGGFPLAIRAGREFLPDLYKDIVERDVVQRYNIRMPSKLSEFAKYIVSNSSSEVSYSKLRNIFGIKSKHTVQDWLGYLEKSYLIFKIERFSFKLKESIIAPKKIYCMDPGLISSVSSNNEKGKLMESVVAIELLRRKYYWHHDMEINYWKNHKQQEIDFVIREGINVLELIQVTYASNKTDIRNREIENLMLASKELKCKNLRIITWDYEGVETLEGANIIFQPLWEWLLEKRIA